MEQPGLTPIGAKRTIESAVGPDQLASAIGSGEAAVFATPSMIALMEAASMALIAPSLPAGITTVGTAVNVAHLQPTPMGAAVRAEAELLESDGRRFLFQVTAWDEAGVIGEGTHERCSVKLDKFQQKAAQRRAGGTA